MLIIIIIVKQSSLFCPETCGTGGGASVCVLPVLLMVTGCRDLELHRSLLGVQTWGAAESHMPPSDCCYPVQGE